MCQQPRVVVVVVVSVYKVHTFPCLNKLKIKSRLNPSSSSTLLYQSWDFWWIRILIFVRCAFVSSEAACVRPSVGNGNGSGRTFEWRVSWLSVCANFSHKGSDRNLWKIDVTYWRVEENFAMLLLRRKIWAAVGCAVKSAKDGRHSEKTCSRMNFVSIRVLQTNIIIENTPFFTYCHITIIIMTW